MTFSRLSLLISVTLTAATLHAQRTPVMEYAALLNSVDISPMGVLELGGDNDILTTVFLPKGGRSQRGRYEKGIFETNTRTGFFHSPQDRGFCWNRHTRQAAKLSV